MIGYIQKENIKWSYTNIRQLICLGFFQNNFHVPCPFPFMNLVLDKYQTPVCIHVVLICSISQLRLTANSCRIDLFCFPYKKKSIYTHCSNNKQKLQCTDMQWNSCPNSESHKNSISLKCLLTLTPGCGVTGDFQKVRQQKWTEQQEPQPFLVPQAQAFAV